jgi:hypothetical protein
LLQSTALDWQRNERRKTKDKTELIQRVLRAGKTRCFIQRTKTMLNASTRKSGLNCYRISNRASIIPVFDEIKDFDMFAAAVLTCQSG